MKHILYFTKEIHSFSGKILYINLVGMVLISLFESIGIFLLIPLLSLTGIMTSNHSGASLISVVSNFFNQIPNSFSLPLILGIYLFLIINQSIFQQKQTMLNAKIQQAFIKHLRERTYQLLLQANWAFFLNKRKSDLINLMTTEIARVGGGIQLFLQFLASLIFTLIQICLAFWLSAKMTAVVLLFGILLIYCSRKFINKSNLIGKNALQLSQTYLATITDHFNGIKEIKSNTLEESHFFWFKTLSDKIEKNIMDFVKLKTYSQLIYKISSSLLIVSFIFLTVKMFQAQPTQLMLIIIIFSRLWPRFSGIQSNLEQLGGIIPSFKALINLQNECVEAKEINDKDLKCNNLIEIKKGLECRNISFRYDKNKLFYTLKNINLHFPINRMTAIVGRSGAGKSTLIDILIGLNQPEQGEVLIDGRILSGENLLSFRRSVSYVPQDPFLFNATLRENLMIVDQNVTEYQIWEALEFSAAAEFVKNLPHGLDTLIGDRGIKLSGGERQRLVLARAILKKPSILVLDEATSALDTENESKIQEALERLKGKMTIIVIAHRLSTIRNADQVIVLDHGEIIQQGQFNQLAIEKKGMFNYLLKQQAEISAL